MANSNQIIAVLEAFGKAYPHQNLSKPLLSYTSLPDRHPSDLLWEAAERTSRLPAISRTSLSCVSWLPARQAPTNSTAWLSIPFQTPWHTRPRRSKMPFTRTEFSTRQPG